MKLKLPYPPSELLPNRKTNRWDKSRISREYKATCVTELQDQVGCIQDPIFLKCSVMYTFHPNRNYNVADPDGLLRAMKPGIDALKLAHVIKDDSFKVLRPVTLDLGEVCEQPWVEINLEGR